MYVCVNVEPPPDIYLKENRHLKTIWHKATHINCCMHFRGYNHEVAVWRR